MLIVNNQPSEGLIVRSSWRLSVRIGGWSWKPNRPRQTDRGAARRLDSACWPPARPAGASWVRKALPLWQVVQPALPQAGLYSDRRRSWTDHQTGIETDRPESRVPLERLVFDVPAVVVVVTGAQHERAAKTFGASLRRHSGTGYGWCGLRRPAGHPGGPTELPGRE